MMNNVVGKTAGDISSYDSQSAAEIEQDEGDYVQVAASSPSVTGNIEYLNGTALPNDVSLLLLSYTKERYEALGKLSFSSLSHYFNTDNTYGELYAQFCNTSLKYLTFVRSSRSTDLGFDRAEFTVTVTEVNARSGSYTVKYYLSDSIEFNFCSVPSKSTGMELEAKISPDSDGYMKFTVLAEDTDVNILIEEMVMERFGYDSDEYYLKDMTIPGNVDIKEMFEEIYAELKSLAKEHIFEQKQQLADYNANPGAYTAKKTADNAYNREAAVAYSYKWVSGDEVVRNPEYSDYSIYGGNCQNYVSQALYESGIPMDWDGNYTMQWKWFDDEVNYNQSDWGRSISWSGTEYFYEYCTENKGSGLVAETDVNIYSVSPGDVMQYVSDDWAKHSVIVSKVIYNDDGTVADILINSNTTDRVDFPLSAYGYTGIRAIRIIGWND